MSAGRLAIRNAHILITGEYDGEDSEYFKCGDPMSLEGAVKDIELSMDEDATLWGDTIALSSGNSYWLQFETDGDVAYTVKVRQPVVKRVSTTAADRSIAALDAARERCGAPEDAKIILGSLMRLDGDFISDYNKPQPIDVEFVWEER